MGSFDLGEADKVLSIFTAEKGILKAVAKAAKKPGTKMAGRADILSVNELLLSKGRTFEIISQAQTIETFPELRSDFERLSYGLYYAELTHTFARGLEEDSARYFDYLIDSLRLQSRKLADSVWLCLEFEMGLLDFLGYKPELTCCVKCREVLHDYNLDRFNIELGGIVCLNCYRSGRSVGVKEAGAETDNEAYASGIHITPLVWKNLVHASSMQLSADLKVGIEKTELAAPMVKKVARFNFSPAVGAAQRLMRLYIEQRASRRFKSLEILQQMNS